MWSLEALLVEWKLPFTEGMVFPIAADLMGFIEEFLLETVLKENDQDAEKTILM